MASMFKQRLLKAGRDFSYSMAVKVVGGETGLTENTVMYPSGSQGTFLVYKHSAADAATTTGRLLIAKHDIPNGGYGIGLPWKMVTGLNIAGAAGTAIYTDANGQLTAAVAGGIVGRIVTARTGVLKSDAVVLFAPESE